MKTMIIIIEGDGNYEFDSEATPHGARWAIAVSREKVPDAGPVGYRDVSVRTMTVTGANVEIKLNPL